MAVKYMISSWNFNNFAEIRLGMVTWGFLRSLIKNLKSKREN